MKNYLITGGAGFIGSNYIHYLLESDSDCRIINYDALTYAGNMENLTSIQSDSRYLFIKGDICDKEAVAEVFERHSVDCVINFAAESHVDRSITAPDVFVKTNVSGTVNLLNAARKAWDTGAGSYRSDVKFLQVSTDEVYGSLGAQGLFSEETHLDPHSPYSASKASADLFVKAYADTYGLPVNITRCSNNYGPCQFPEKLIPLMVNNALRREPLPVYGDGMQVRDWLHVSDHCRAIDMVARRGTAGRIYNIGGSNEKTNLEIVRLILAYLFKEVDHTINETLIKHVTDRQGHDRRYAIDSSRIQSELGWTPAISFENGIASTIRWILNNPVWMEHATSGVYRQYYSDMYGGRV